MRISYLIEIKTNVGCFTLERVRFHLHLTLITASVLNCFLSCERSELLPLKAFPGLRSVSQAYALVLSQTQQTPSQIHLIKKIKCVTHLVNARPYAEEPEIKS